jgi:threonine dehydrogenase-like Zn-dependent dehydrogenase
MKAVAVYPEKREVKLIERAEPRIQRDCEVRVRMLEVGVCGTDKDLCAFVFGTSPAGCDHFILGHESLARVMETGPAVESLRPGDLVVGKVRLPCAEPGCAACRRGYQDFCSTGKYRERGIQSLDGFMAEQVVEEEQYLYKVPAGLREVGILVEPLTIAEKAFRQAACVQERLPWKRERPCAVVLGAGAIGLLGAMKSILAGYRTYIYSLLPSPNPSAAIAGLIGAKYISSQEATVAQMLDEVRSEGGEIDLIYEAIGSAPLAFDCLRVLGPNGVFLFIGVPYRGALGAIDMEKITANLIQKNQAVFGSVNAGRQAFLDAIRDLELIHARWPRALPGMITGRFPMEEFLDPVMGRAGGIKNVIRIG